MLLRNSCKHNIFLLDSLKTNLQFILKAKFIIITSNTKFIKFCLNIVFLTAI